VKPLKPEQWILLAVVLAAVAYIGADLAGRNRSRHDLYAPQKQPLPDDPDALLRAGIATDGHAVVCMPEEHHAGYTYTPHRYPRTLGGEITNTIHHGFSSMRVPAVSDVQWIISPPSEVQW